VKDRQRKITRVDVNETEVAWLEKKDVVIAAWNTVLFDKFVRFRDVSEAIQFGMALGPAGEIGFPLSRE
jgi:hypothetical protein